MTETEFWGLIDESRAAMTDERDGNMARQEARLRELLERLLPQEIVAFHRHFYTFVTRAFHWDLWAVANIVGEGCSDDWFDYFRFWLISSGKTNYERALADPAAIDRIFVDSGSDDFFFERISYVPGKAYRAVVGSALPDLPSTEPLVERGQRWADDTELRLRYPALCAKYWDRA